MGAPVLVPHAQRQPYSALCCPACGKQLLSHQQALVAPPRGVTPDGDSAYTKWCGPCRRHVNWCEASGDDGELQTAHGITSAQFMQRVQQDYGEAGLFAAESMCLTADDYALGYDHCVDCIAPALEEELQVMGGEPTAAALADLGEQLSPEAVLEQFIIR